MGKREFFEIFRFFHMEVVATTDSPVFSLLRRYQMEGYYPGAVCFVFDREKILLREALGEVSADTWFDLASVSKILCTTLILSLVEEGRFALSSPVLPLLPFEIGPVTRRQLRDITLRQLLTHTSSLPPWYPFYTQQGDFGSILEKALKALSPSEGMVYSDLNFMLLGEIFSAAAKMDLRRGLTHYVKEPLQIPHLAYSPVKPSLCAPSSYGNPIEERMCADMGLSFSHWRKTDRPLQGQVNDGNAYYYFQGAAGHAGVFANGEALTALCQFYMTTRRPVFRSAVEETIEGRGLGFDKGEVFPRGCGHTGFTGTSLYFSCSHNVGAVLLTNKFYRQGGEPPGNSNDFRRALHHKVLEVWGR